MLKVCKINLCNSIKPKSVIVYKFNFKMNTLHPRIYSWFYIAMIPLSLNLSKYNIYVVHIRHEFLPGGLFETSTYTSLIAVEVYMNLNREKGE